MKIQTLSLILCAALIALSGCTAGAMQTSHQLDDGELVASFVGELPGTGGIPRVSANLGYGLADVGDVNLHLGTSLFGLGAGAGARVYPTALLTLSAQGSYNLSGYFSADGLLTGLLTGSGRVMTSTDKGRMFYGGLEVLVVGLHGEFVEPYLNEDGKMEVVDVNHSLRYVHTSAGLVLGVEGLLDSGNTVQLELAFRPFSCHDSGCGLLPFNDRGYSHYLLQLGVAIHLRFDDEPAPARR